MTLAVDVSHRQGAFALDAAFESSGRLTALFGTSGSGKTTLVNLIGGLVRPTSGRIAIEGRVLVDTKAGVFVPAHRRRVGYVFQDARLFPHLTVSQNLRFGRFFAPAGQRYADFDAVVEMLGIAPLLQRRPGHLSGGEKQRVAIGRALIASPQLILMDEPLASLDDARKAEILPFVEKLRDETRIPIVYVSHSIAEVSRLATDVVILSEGGVVAAGPAREVLSRPDTVRASDPQDVGVLLDLEIVAQDARFGLTRLRALDAHWHLPRLDLPVGVKVRARVRARDVMIATSAPSGISALNVVAGKVAAVTEGGGADALVRLECGEAHLLARLTRRSVHDLDLSVGREVFAIVKAVTFEGGSYVAASPQAST